MAFCIMCGENIAEAQFCTFCGAAQTTGSDAEPTQVTGWKDKIQQVAQQASQQVKRETGSSTASGSPVPAAASDTAWRARGANVTAAEAAAGLRWHGMSHEAGRNAHVRLFSDRIEREKPRGRLSVSSAAQDHEVIPIRSVTSVNIKKDGLTLSKVTVKSGGGEIPFRFRHEDAQSFRGAIMPLVIAAGHPPSQAAVPTPTAAEPDVADQIRKLAELRDAGIVSEEEFQAKKAELLKRM